MSLLLGNLEIFGKRGFSNADCGRIDPQSEDIRKLAVTLVADGDSRAPGARAWRTGRSALP